MGISERAARRSSQASRTVRMRVLPLPGPHLGLLLGTEVPPGQVGADGGFLASHRATHVGHSSFGAWRAIRRAWLG